MVCVNMYCIFFALARFFTYCWMLWLQSGTHNVAFLFLCCLLCVHVTKKGSVQLKEAQQENVWTIGGQQKHVNCQVNSPLRNQMPQLCRSSMLSVLLNLIVLIKALPHFAGRCLICLIFHSAAVNELFSNPALNSHKKLFVFTHTNTHSACVHFRQPALWGPKLSFSAGIKLGSFSLFLLH